MRDFQLLAWLFFVPGLIWTVGPGAPVPQRGGGRRHPARQPEVRRERQAAAQDSARIRTVLSRCWELPYCRDNIREKCPIYVKRRGPCWWYKEGCMCEERIILQAVINTDWKQKAAKPDMAYNFGQNRAGLTPAAKRERCRNCVIYNEHQRQKYKALVTVALIVVPVAPVSERGLPPVLAVGPAAWRGSHDAAVRTRRKARRASRCSQPADGRPRMDADRRRLRHHAVPGAEIDRVLVLQTENLDRCAFMNLETVEQIVALIAEYPVPRSRWSRTGSASTSAGRRRPRCRRLRARAAGHAPRRMPRPKAAADDEALPHG